jgi:hypothetical protein
MHTVGGIDLGVEVIHSVKWRYYRTDYSSAALLNNMDGCVTLPSFKTTERLFHSYHLPFVAFRFSPFRTGIDRSCV